MAWEHWDGMRERMGSEYVALTLTDCVVESVTASAVVVYSRPRTMRLEFPLKVPMQWTIGDDGVVANWDLVAGDRPTAVRLPKWLKDAKLQELQERLEARKFDQGGPAAQGTLFDLEPQPHRCGRPCKTVPCPECAAGWKIGSVDKLEQNHESTERATEDADGVGTGADAGGRGGTAGG